MSRYWYSITKELYAEFSIAKMGDEISISLNDAPIKNIGNIQMYNSGWVVVYRTTETLKELGHLRYKNMLFCFVKRNYRGYIQES